MKYLKKLIIIILLFPFLVNAKENINYDWGDYLEEWPNIYDVAETKDGYVAYGSQNAIYYDKSGNVLKEVSLDDVSCDIVVYNKESKQFLCLDSYGDYSVSPSKYYTNAYYLDEDYEIIKETKFEIDLLRSYYSYTNELEDEIAILDIDNLYTIILSKDLSKLEIYSVRDQTEEDLKKYWQDYYILIDLNNNEENEDKEYYSIIKNDNYIALAYYDYELSTYGVEVYDKKGNLISSNNNISENYINIELTNDGYYVIIENDISNRSDCRNEETCKSQLELKKYNFNSKEIYSKELQTIVNDNYNYYHNSGIRITKTKILNNNLFLLSNYIVAPKKIDLEKEITGKKPSIIKYYFTYDIETKTDGNGTIKAITSSIPGEPVTFEITPIDGYEIGLIKVTDANGNVITFTSNTFTMPSSDVTIEATFVASNPNTSDYIMYLLIIIGSIILFRLLLKERKV
ncbi:MAG: hypothetical protein ACI4XM_08335 [Candidatus Coprovivens sp.]